MEESKVDFAIITAIELERQAVCQAFGIGDQHRIREGDRTYWKIQLDLVERQFYEIVVTQLPDVASIDAALAAQALITTWSPEAVLMVGIAGAAKDKMQLGDLVLGKEVYYYERGKDTLTGRLTEHKQYPADSKLWDRATKMAMEKLASWKLSLPKKPDGTDTYPNKHEGVIASGERVIAHTEIRNEIAAKNRKIDAIEMEGYGVSSAAWKQDRPVRCLVIRAISDRADTQKNDVWQPYAAAVAAEFTKHFLLDRPLPPRNSPHRVPRPQNASVTSPCRLIADDLKSGNLIPFLGPGINSSFYIDLAFDLADLVQDDLVPRNGENNFQNENLIHTLIGIPSPTCHYWPPDESIECPMLKKMAEKKNCPRHIEQGLRLAVSQINLRYISQYYILRNNLESLYDNLYAVLERLDKKHRPSSLHQFLAKLPHLMSVHNYPRRSPGLPFQLIVTTNYDDLLERAFLDAQQPFDVVFYIADGLEKGKFKHKPYQGDVQTIGANDSDRLPLRSPWGHSPHPHPIILKLFGTWKESWENNFVATEQQMAHLISTLEHNLPTSLVTILKKGNILFMGYSPSDSDLQLLMHCFWPANRITGKSWLLHQAKPGDLEQELWKSRNVALLNMASSEDEPSSEDEFVKQLQRTIEARFH